MSNCLFFAIYMFFTEGGFIVLRKSKYMNWSHIMWTRDFKTFSHYVPIKYPLKFPWIGKILFKGRVKTEKIIIKDEK